MSRAPDRREGSSRPARRELTAAVLTSAAAGGLVVFAASQTWVTFSVLRRAPLPPLSGALAGSSYAPAVPAAGLVLLAAAIVLLAVRRNGRVAVGALMTISGAAIAWTGTRALTGGLTEAVSGDSTDVPVALTDVSSAWPLATVVAGVVGVFVGVLVVVRGRGWPAMGGRYDRGTPAGGVPAPPPPRTDEERARLAWNALDRGEDPTDPAAPGAGHRPA